MVSVPPATFQSLVVTLVLTRLDYGNAVLVGLPAYLVQRLQSVGLLIAAARLIFHLRSADHITDALATLHWLRVAERIEYKIALLTFKVLYGSASPYLRPFVPVRSLPGRWSLRSTGTNRLLVPPVKRSTICSRAFPVARPKTWNALPERCNIFPVCMHLSLPAQNMAFQEVFS